MQLVAYGAQDIYLTGNPQITFFKVVYRRHTNFSMEAIEQTWNGDEKGANGRCTATISRNGDLVYRMYLELTGTAHATGAVKDISAAAITDVELEIGGQKIDKQTGHWMNVWSLLTQPNTSGLSGESTARSGTLYQNMTGMGGCMAPAASQDVHHFVPLQFWFCRNPGLALPLIALQYHEVKVVLNHTIGNTTTHYGANAKNRLWCDYIYLDTDERRRFAQVSHEYLIEQVQEQSLTAGKGDLNFNHPVKELVFTAAELSTPLEGTGIKLKLNGHDRFAGRDFKYFTRTQVWQSHTGPGGLAPPATAATGKFSDGIGVYSFALKPEEHQPSGTCNFSRIDNATMEADSGNATKIFAVNYNVLRIMSGMGGLAYSN